MHSGANSHGDQSDPGTATGQGAAQQLAVAAIGVATVATVLLSLHSVGTPWGTLGRHTAYTVLGLVVPGTLVHKALRGSAGSWLADLTLGMTLGFGLELGAWMVASMLDVRDWLWSWPLLTLVVLASPAARARVLQRPDRPWPTLPLLAVAGSALTAFWLIFSTYVKYVPTAPTGVHYYPDLLWHMGLSAEAKRAFPLGTPQVFEDGPLHYHWFSNAHVAAASLISGEELNTLWIRLWWVPVVMAGIVLTAELARRLSGSAWAGAVAAPIAASIVGWPFWPDVMGQFSNISAQSPSQLFSVPLTLLTMHALVDLLRREEGIARGPAAVAAMSALASSGAKSSTLPVLTGALGIAFLAALVLRRQRLLLLASGAIATLISLVAMKAVSGGGTGQVLMFLHSLTVLPAYPLLLPDDALDYDNHVAGGIWSTPGVGKILFFGLALGMGFSMIRGLAMFLPVVQRTLRRDLGAWLIAGACFASFLAFFLIGHQGYSEYYFAYGTMPFGAALWGWSIVEIVRRDRTRIVVAAVTALVVGAITTWTLWQGVTRPPATTPDVMLDRLREFLTTATILLGALALLTVVARSRRRPLSALMPVAAVTLITPFIIGAFVPNLQRIVSPEPVLPTTSDVLQESTAGVWIREHVPENDLMATNIHCNSRTGPHCYSHKWWISGIGERRVLIESWDYTPRAAHVGYYDLPLLELNDRAFTDPTPSTLKELGDKGVTWLVADHQPGYDQPSPKLDELATRRYANETITIYELGR